MPVTLTVCWLPAVLLLLSVMTSEAERVPVAVGVNLTLIVQLPLAATDPPHVLVWEKSPGLVPLKAMFVIVRATLPVLFNVNVCAVLVEPRFWLLNVRLEVVVPAMGAFPLPVSVRICGLPLALSAMLNDPVRLKIPPGVNVTLIVQVPLGASGLVQLLV